MDENQETKWNYIQFLWILNLIWIFFSGAFIIIDVILYLIKKEEFSEVEKQAYINYFNFFFSYLIYMMISFILMIILIWFLLALIVWILFVIFSIIWIIQNLKGLNYKYPLTLNLF